jgi:hypothetical protein
MSSPAPIASSHNAPAVRSADAKQTPPATSGTTGSVPQDHVQLSAAAQSALREASETPAQTAKEARQGDVQAKHLLAKQAVARASHAQSIHVTA